MPTTPHTRPKAHGIQLVGSKSSTFIPSFKWIGYKQIKHNTFQIFVSIRHKIKNKLNEHLISLFQYEAQSSYYLWL